MRRRVGIRRTFSFGVDVKRIGDEVRFAFSGKTYAGTIVDMSGKDYVVELSSSHSPCKGCGDRAQIGQRLVIRPELLRDD